MVYICSSSSDVKNAQNIMLVIDTLDSMDLSQSFQNVQALQFYFQGYIKDLQSNV